MKKILLSSISGGLQLLLNLILSFIVIAQLISKFGSEFYGILSLVLLIGNLNTFFFFGFNTSLVKFISQQGKSEESDVDITTTFTFLLVLIIPITFLGIYFNNTILIHVLDIPNRFISYDLLWMYNFLFISNSIIFISQIPAAVLDSMQKIYINNFYQMIYSSLVWGLIFVVINLSNNIMYIGLSYFIAALIWSILVFESAWRNWGNIHLPKSSKIYIDSFKKQFNYGFQLYSGSIVAMFNEPFTKILISHFIGLSEVGFYDIALRIRNQITNVFSKIYYPLYPYMSQISDHNKLRTIIHQIEQKAYFFTIPLLSFLLFFIPTFIDLWIGRNVTIISDSIIIITSGYILFSVNVFPIYFYLMVKGHPSKTIIIQSINVIVNGIVFWGLYSFWGYYAALYSSLFSIFSSFLGCLYYQKKYLNSLIFDNTFQIIKGLAIFAILFAISALLNFILCGALLKMLLMPWIIYFLSVPLFRVFKVFSMDDINRFTHNPKLNGMLCKILLNNYERQ